MDEYRQEVLDYLNSQADSYFTSRCTTKQIVLADTELIDHIAAEHKQCVEKFSCDRQWSLQDACDEHPGVTPAGERPLTFDEGIAHTARFLLRESGGRYDVEIWAAIGPDVIAGVQAAAKNNNGNYTNDDVRQAIGKAITKRLAAWACGTWNGQEVNKP